MTWNLNWGQYTKNQVTVQSCLCMGVCTFCSSTKWKQAVFNDLYKRKYSICTGCSGSFVSLSLQALVHLCSPVVNHITLSVAGFLLSHGKSSMTGTITGRQGHPSSLTFAWNSSIMRGWKLYFKRLFDGVSSCSTDALPSLQQQRSQHSSGIFVWHWKRVSGV